MSRDDLAIRGWLSTDDAAAVIHSTLGTRATPEPLPPASGWRCAAPIGPDVPVGSISRLVMLEGDAPATLRFVPGSQGCGPPLAGEGEAIETVSLGAASALLLDGRCWFEAPPHVRATLWSRSPGGSS